MFNVVLVAFEGPDRYSFVGGLATRMIDLSGALLERGHRVHHLYVGDPSLPTREERYDGQLVLERWCQWISRYHPKDVYDGEEGKYLDFSRTVPPHLATDVIAAAASRGERSVLLFEDWQTAAAAINTATLLVARADRSAALFWNANNTYGFGRIDFPLLRRAASITTISRYMRMELAKVGVEAAVLPNGIADRYLRPLPPTDITALRKSFGDRPTFVKVARFDVDKRWLWAIDAIATMRDAGLRPRFVMRGSRSPYAEVVGDRIFSRGLTVERLALPQTAASRDLAAAIAATTAEVVFLDFFIDEKALRALYASADGVLANSEKEPFGLVGLEVMASGGIAFLGRTGEDYAVPFGNAVVVQSDDPRELLTSYLMLRERPELARAIRTEGRATAKRFAWPRILEGYESVWETAFVLTG
ncbi:MAG TPA: glycosyltransferase family 4 protein [Candidatus Limnocylindria bacterium]|jgi:glycosyltransferase involved in cell wall biosynthesis|nr:glycosyltransferase family 4 protein [Candidatus Limnocylindria bacterium]